MAPGALDFSICAMLESRERQRTLTLSIAFYMTCQSSSGLQVTQNSARLSANRLNDSALSPLELARRLPFTRREFLCAALSGVTLCGHWLCSGMLARAGVPKEKEGSRHHLRGCARGPGTFAPEGQEEYLAHLMKS